MLNARLAALCRESLAAVRTADCCLTRTWLERLSPAWRSPRQRRRRPKPSGSTESEPETDRYVDMWFVERSGPDKAGVAWPSEYHSSSFEAIHVHGERAYPASALYPSSVNCSKALLRRRAD